jgi:hypothetical protein
MAIVVLVFVIVIVMVMVVVVVVMVMFVFSAGQIATEAAGGNQNAADQEAECTPTRSLFSQTMKLHRQLIERFTIHGLLLWAARGILDRIGNPSGMHYRIAPAGSTTLHTSTITHICGHSCLLQGVEPFVGLVEAVCLLTN